MGYIEYLATLTSPNPKGTIKAIDARRRAVMVEKKRAGLLTDEELESVKLFKDDHRNTTFFEAIEKEGGDEALDDLKAFFGDDAKKNKSVEMYRPDAEEIDFFHAAINGNREEEPEEPTEDFDAVEF